MTYSFTNISFLNCLVTKIISYIFIKKKYISNIPTRFDKRLSLRKFLNICKNSFLEDGRIESPSELFKSVCKNCSCIISKPKKIIQICINTEEDTYIFI